VADDISYDKTFRVDTINKTVFANKMQGSYYSNDSSMGITNTTGFLVCTEYDNEYIVSAFGTSDANGIYIWDGSTWESDKKFYTHVTGKNPSTNASYGYALRYSGDGHWMLSNYGGAGGIFYENSGTEPESNTWYVSDNGDSPAGIIIKVANSGCRNACALQIKNGLITGCV
jgi:hypothetical protein